MRLLAFIPVYEDVQEPTLEELIELGKDPKVVAIGETGLDYFRVEEQDMTWQHDRFIRHIQAGIAVNKPLIIHTRAAADDTMPHVKRAGRRCL